MVSAVIVPQRKELPRGIEDAVSGVTGEKSRPTRTKHPETDSKILDHKAIGKETNRMPEDQFKRQLIAFLHDPPCKFSDIRFHESASETLLRNAVDNWDEESRRPDWVASAGDRLCLPKLRYIKPEEFSHPFSGEKKTISALGELERETGEAQRRVLTETPSTSQEKLFLMWRFWKNELARVRKDSGLWPADTRLPNHTIWNHMGITAALSRCEGTEEHRPIQASLLTVQFGPVQDWIEAARSTKDCWAGSHILSRISAAAMKSLADTYGPTAILSPDLRGQPLYDLAEFELINKFGRWRETEAGGDPSLLRIASIPHKFTALIPSAGAEEAAQKAVEAAQGFWEKTAEKAWSLWESQGLSRGWKKEWDEQIGNWLQYAWQVTEIPKADSRGDISPYVETWKKTTGNSGESVEAEIAFALAIPDANADTRNYRSVRQGMGWGLLKKEGKKVVTYTTGAWEAIADIHARDLAARRQARNFRKNSSESKASRDQLDGKNPVIDREGQEQIRKAGRGLEKNDLDYGAPNLVKRAYPELFREELKTLGINLTMGVPSTHELTDKKEGTDNETPEADESKYFAVLSLDGDEMGAWASGSKNTTWEECLPSAVVETLKKIEDPTYQAALRTLLKSRRSLRPSQMLQFSEALKNYAMGEVPKIVRKHEGFLIYAGGDDVLAMLPPRKSLACAEELQTAFRKNYTDDGRTEILPGSKMGACVGIAIAHVKEPLQGVIRRSRKALKRAKGLKKSGKLKAPQGVVSVDIDKHSGETMHWSYPGQAHLGEMWEELDRINPPKAFGKKLSRLLGQYTSKREDTQGILGGPLAVCLRDEISHAVNQWHQKVEKLEEKKEALGKLMEKSVQEMKDASLEDFLGPILTWGFLK